MTISFSIALQRVSFHFANGQRLFEALDATFDARHTGLVGRNGVGKSVFGRLLAGQLQPSSGRILRAGPVAYLPQVIEVTADTRIIDLTGFADCYDALQRVNAGALGDGDIELLDGRWDILDRLLAALQDEGLGHLRLGAAAATLSGGERTRVALLGAFLSDAELLVLDEPSNHLDGASRERLAALLQRWPRGLLLISHDRTLLDGMQRIVELSATGLRSYGGNYSFYRDTRNAEQQAAQQALCHARNMRKRGERELQAQQQRQQQRAAKGARSGRESNQAQILLDRQKGRSEASAGRLNRQLQAARQGLEAAVREAGGLAEKPLPVVLHADAVQLPAGKRVLSLHGARAPFSAAELPDFELFGPRRLAIVGPNGCGKSSLLAMLAGQLMPAAGDCRVEVPCATLDQHLSCLPATDNAQDYLRRHNPGLSVALARTRLAQLGLDAARVELASERLSGGERLKLALAGLLDTEPGPALLLLDEPDNHLDLVSLQAVEGLLGQYRGALVVVSHDAAFIEALGITDRLEWAGQGWRYLRVD